MTSKEAILNAIITNTRERFAMPSLAALEENAIKYADPIAQFSTVLEQGGGHGLVLPKGKSVAEAVNELYPEAKRVADTLGVMPAGDSVFHPDEVDEPALLNGTDVAIIKSELGVAENACCWIEEYVRHRAIFFIAEALVIVLRKTDVVNNMHEAYAQLPDKRDVPFGCFISGPSKTADIEQALVFGAHGAREVTVLIVDD